MKKIDWIVEDDKISITLNGVKVAETVDKSFEIIELISLIKILLNKHYETNI